MRTPISDFVRSYGRSGVGRLHMPGHKGVGSLGERYDITEIAGADQLYAPAGIIAESEANAAALFGTRRTCYSTEGSSQCVKAMLFLAVTGRRPGTAPLVLAARNVHKSYVQAAGLIGFETEWLWPEGDNLSVCACPITPAGLEAALEQMETPPCAVYITSPDYLGNMQDIKGLADAAHRHGALLLADNAHGAYLKLLTPSRHPMDLGCDLCCDSAHKTLPVLTGGAYLHIGRDAPAGLEEGAKEALALFGSTSPSYLTLVSLDEANPWLAARLGGARDGLDGAMAALDRCREALAAAGWVLAGEEPLKLTIHASASGRDGRELAGRLREHGMEPEYADRDHLVLMAGENNDLTALAALPGWLGEPAPEAPPVLPLGRGERAMSVREALLAPWEAVPAAEALGRVCACPAVSCPPAVPIAMAGERIGPEAAALLARYGQETVAVVKNEKNRYFIP